MGAERNSYILKKKYAMIIGTFFMDGLSRFCSVQLT